MRNATLDLETIKLHDELKKDLAMCNNSFERANVEAICGKEIRRFAKDLEKERKLTPGEVAIAENYGYRRFAD